MSARETAFKILLNFENSKQRLENIISHRIQNQTLSPQEVKFVYNLCSGVVRNLMLFDWKLTVLYKGDYKKALNIFKTILRLALYELDFLDFIPPRATVNEYVNLAKSKLDKRLVATVNALLRNYLRNGKRLDPAKKFKYIDTRISIQYSYPEWLIKRWLSLWGEQETLALCKALNDRPTFDLRINRHNIEKVDFINILKEHQIHFIPSKYFQQVIKVTDIQSVNKLGLLERGYCSVQDESALLALELLAAKKGEIILDACAAPGGKYTGSMEDDNTKIVAIGMDVNNKRLKVIRENCSRLQIRFCRLVQGDAIYPPFKSRFDKILVDVPCSGLGTIQKHPDIKWRRSLDDLYEFQALQLNILQSISTLIKKGGEIVYSTCTIDPLENESVIVKFLELQKGIFSIIEPSKRLSKFAFDHPYIQTFPHRDQMDGSFAVKLRKN